MKTAEILRRDGSIYAQRAIVLLDKASERDQLRGMGWVLVISAAICVVWIAFAIYSTAEMGRGAGARFTVGELVAESRRDRGAYSQ